MDSCRSDLPLAQRVEATRGEVLVGYWPESYGLSGQLLVAAKIPPIDGTTTARTRYSMLVGLPKLLGRSRACLFLKVVGPSYPILFLGDSGQPRVNGLARGYMHGANHTGSKGVVITSF